MLCNIGMQYSYAEATHHLVLKCLGLRIVPLRIAPCDNISRESTHMAPFIQMMSQVKFHLLIVYCLKFTDK